MTAAERLRAAADAASQHALRLIAPDGALDDDACERLWRRFDFPLSAPVLEPMVRPFAAALARQAEAGGADALIATLKRRGAAPYAVIGDSHSAQLVRRSSRNGRWLLPLHWLCHAASARGLSNAEGRSGASGVVRRALDVSAALDIPAVLKFGQVDLEFVYAFKRIDEGRWTFDPAHYDAFVDETVARYADALAVLAPSARRRRIAVASVFPPSLSDRAWRNGYVNAAAADLHASAPGAKDEGVDLRRAVSRLSIPDLRTRTAAHARFNARLKAAADALGFSYLDQFQAFLGADGLLRPNLRGAGGADHHLNFQAARRPTIAGLWGFLGEHGHG